MLKSIAQLSLEQQAFIQSLGYPLSQADCLTMTALQPSLMEGCFRLNT
jgi:hypothetical protein